MQWLEEKEHIIHRDPRGLLECGCKKSPAIFTYALYNFVGSSKKVIKHGFSPKRPMNVLNQSQAKTYF